MKTNKQIKKTIASVTGARWRNRNGSAPILIFTEYRKFDAFNDTASIKASEAK